MKKRLDRISPPLQNAAATGTAATIKTTSHSLPHVSVHLEPQARNAEGHDALGQDLREFVTAARANPGKYTCATSTTTLRMACEFLQASAGIKLLIYFRPGTPPAVVAKMQEILRGAAGRQEVKDALATFVHEPLDLIRDDVTAMNRREIAQWAKLVRDQKIQFTN